MKKNVDDLIKEIKYEKQNAIENGIIRKEKPQSEINEKDMYCKLPNNWRWIRLGDYCLKATDYVASGSFASIKSNVNYYNTENYALMVKTADFANNFTKNLTYTDESGYKFLSNSNLFGGELILSNIGSIGKVFKVPYLNRPMTLASNTIMIKFTNDKLADYIYYYFKSTYGQNALKSISSGTSMLKFNKTQLKTLPLPIPSLETQTKIVEALDKAQELIDKRKEQIEALDELVKSRFIEMFGDPIINSKGWQTKNWNEILVIKNGKGQKSIEDKNGIYPICGSGGIMSYGNDYICNENTVIIGRKGNINKPILMREKFWNVDTAFGLEPNKKYINADYLYMFCEMYNFEKHNKAVTIPSLTKSDLLKIEMALPPIELQNEFADFVKQVDKLKYQMETSLKELEDNFNSLMQKAFKGELF